MRDKILIVDDNDAGRYVKRHILEQAGYATEEAREGYEGLRAIVAGRPDLVLLDVKLPDLSGIELCRRLRDNQVNVAVLMTSAAFTDPADRVAALEGGADGYLIEPIDPNELLASIRALLRMRKAEQELRFLNETLEERIAERSRELAAAYSDLAAEKQNAARAEEALWHSQKMEGLGRLAGGIAHDFNNLLTVVLGNLELIDREVTRSGGAPKLLRNIRSSHRAASDCAAMVRQLLVFARRDRLRLEVVDLNAAVAGLEEFMHRVAGERIALEIALAPQAVCAQIDPANFEAALLNLVMNACDAMPDGGKLAVGTGHASIGGAGSRPAGIPTPADILPGEYAVVSIADTGTGMSEDVIAHAFEPFFTTKDVGKGSGLGLSQVFGFVKQSNGHIAVESAVGQGTRFGIFFPLIAPSRAARARPAGAAPEALAAGQGTILVVEDNNLVLDYVVEATRELGYRVLQATTGREALNVLAGGEKIDLLFTDVVMPEGMSGIELACEVRRRRPDVKVLITSGYSGGVGTELESGAFASIAKPYSSAELARRLREVLSA